MVRILLKNGRIVENNLSYDMFMKLFNNREPQNDMMPIADNTVVRTSFIESIEEIKDENETYNKAIDDVLALIKDAHGFIRSDVFEDLISKTIQLKKENKNEQNTASDKTSTS